MGWIRHQNTAPPACQPAPGGERGEGHPPAGAVARAAAAAGRRPELPGGDRGNRSRRHGVVSAGPTHAPLLWPRRRRHRRTNVHRLASVMCWLLLGAGVAPAFAQPAEEAQKKLQGTWTATKAERDGKAADDVAGHRLSFTGNRFQIQSKDGKPLYAGTFRLDPGAKPAAFDFEHTEGALKGKVWKGIYALAGDTLTTCDNAPDLGKGRPAAFEAKTGSGYVLITFTRAKP